MKQAGIYAIVHLPSGRRYIGSSVAVLDRWCQHRGDLKRGRHVNKGLQKGTIYMTPLQSGDSLSAGRTFRLSELPLPLVGRAAFLASAADRMNLAVHALARPASRFIVHARSVAVTPMLPRRIDRAAIADDAFPRYAFVKSLRPVVQFSVCRSAWVHTHLTSPFRASGVSSAAPSLALISALDGSAAPRLRWRRAPSEPLVWSSLLNRTRDVGARYLAQLVSQFHCQTRFGVGTTEQ